MKTLGMIGGTGWVSTMEYYRLINIFTNQRLGGLNSARILLYSVNYADIEAINKKNDSLSMMATMKYLAIKLQNAEADGIILCANTLHRYAEQLEQVLQIPLIHIAEATSREILTSKIRKVGILGTRITMEKDFYHEKLGSHNIVTIIPEEPDRLFIQNCITQELLKNEIRPESKSRFLEIINKMGDNGAEGIVLACTEIPLLIKQEDTNLKVFNTLEIHAKAAVDFACE